MAFEAIRNILVIGSGSIGLRHAASLRHLCPQVEIVFLREGDRAINAGTPMDGCRIGCSLAEEMDQGPDLLVVANPSSLHLRYLEAAIVNRVPFYAEKPLVTNWHDLEALKRIVSEYAPLPSNIVGCNLRFLPSLAKVRSLLSSGAIGTVVRVTLEAGQWLPDWRPQQDYRASYSAKRELGGGVLLDLVHEIDSARWLLGDFTRLQGMCGKYSTLDIETEDVATICMDRPGGPLVTIQLDYVSRTPIRRYCFVGELGAIEWSLPQQGLTITRSGGRSERVDLDESAFSVPLTYVHAMEELLLAIGESRPTCQPLEEGIRALEIALTIIRENG